MTPLNTSIQAALRQTAAKKTRDRDRIINFLKSREDFDEIPGRTRRQIAEYTGIKINTVNGRCADLIRDGLLEVKNTAVEEGCRVGILTIVKRAVAGANAAQETPSIAAPIAAGGGWLFQTGKTQTQINAEAR